jgi:hypothetical protein
MSGRNSRRIAPALVLALVLALTFAQPGVAARRGAPAASAQESGLVERAWVWLSEWWNGQAASSSHGLTRLWGETGFGMDPNGKARTANMGPEMDPDGKARTADFGPGMDPNGGH